MSKLFSCVCVGGGGGGGGWGGGGGGGEKYSKMLNAENFTQHAKL